MDRVNEYALMACLRVQAAFLFLESEKEAADGDEDGDGSAEVHAGERPGQAAADQPGNERSDTPGDVFAFKAFVNKGLAKPLVNRILAHHTPKKALITTETNTRNKQAPAQPMTSLLISCSPEFQRMYTRTPP